MDGILNWQGREEGGLYCNPAPANYRRQRNLPTAATTRYDDKFHRSSPTGFRHSFKLDAAKQLLISIKSSTCRNLQDANIDERASVPFWLFNADIYADIKYKGTKTKSWYSSGEDWTSTEYFALDRTGSVSFDLVPVDGSKKMADDLMESLEPYDFSEAVDFNTAYLSGFFADKYDVTAEETIERANED